MPVNHPKTDPKTGLNWWTNHLQQESRVYGIGYEEYDSYLDTCPCYHTTKTPEKQSGRSTANDHVPGSDAWIAMKAKENKKQRKKRAKDRVANSQTVKTVASRTQAPTTKQSGARQKQEMSYEDQDGGYDDTEGLIDLGWRYAPNMTTMTVMIVPPKNATMKHWMEFLFFVPKGNSLYEALYARKEYLLDRLASATYWREVHREISEQLVIEYTPAGFRKFQELIAAWGG
ncbi:MAG: hypothetical protein Q9170_007064 [Blastenia crenularia]